MANFIQMAISGDAVLAQTFNNLGRRSIKAIARRSVEKGGQVVAKYARQFAPVDKRRKSGEHLRDTIVVKVKSYTKSGVVIAIIGPASKRAPHKHLVEFGSVAKRPAVAVRPAVQGKPQPKNPGGRWAKLGTRTVFITHTGRMPAFHFLKRASEKSRTEVRQVMAATYRDSLMRAAKKEMRSVNKIAGAFKPTKFANKDLKKILNLK